MKNMLNKIKDYFDVKKYKRQRNSFENKYLARNEQYIELLEADRTMINENISLKEQIRELKKEIKDLKKEVMENGK